MVFHSALPVNILVNNGGSNVTLETHPSPIELISFGPANFHGQRARDFLF